ncbi:L-histidine N(alpha)-methyltransferase [Allohahella marinimesophila]|uniref:L-histidine N(Alpha)-methyltransferase n=1 Tax=Allohahella marinimesophila TaxID=1054972 RepID=A0ABP7P300_9GAMM
MTQAVLDSAVTGISDDPATAELLADVLDGLSQPQKRLPSKYFYDRKGSELFEQICELPEYYPTRTELGMLDGVAAELSTLLPDVTEIVEFGSGNCTKVEKLLKHMPAVRRYLPIDVSETFLLHHCERLDARFPRLDVVPVVGDFTSTVDLAPAEQHKLEPKRLGFFPGSTIGNLTHDEAIAFLRTAADTLGSGNYLLIGVDTLKSPRVLIPAYDDSQGITAAFNLNILERLERELGAEVDITQFAHEARFNESEGRIEMHLVSKSVQSIRLAQHTFEFEQGESIHTENSHKYTDEGFCKLAGSAGWRCETSWLDEKSLFSMHLLQAV